MTRTPRVALGILLFAIGAPGSPTAQQPDTLIIATGGAFSPPVPGLSRANEAIRISDLLFLRLGRHGATTYGDQAAVPELARSWQRLDSVALAFELDPRARWHDGRPVTADDVLWSFARARDPKASPATAPLLQGVTAVETDSRGRIIIRFARPYGEQLYDATYHVQVLPRHLLAGIPADSLATTAFATMPVGNGPYRVQRNQPGEFIELTAVPDFFLGRPTIDQLVWRLAPSHEARLNMLLSGAADVQEDLIPPVHNLERVKERRDLRVARFPSQSVIYLLYNQRNPKDTGQQHPALSRAAVRRALGLAIDRGTIVQSQLRGFASPSASPAPAAAWYHPLAPAPLPWDPKKAVAALEADGWHDSNGDGIREREDQPLALTILVPASSTARVQLAQIVEQQWRAVGVDAAVQPVEGPVWGSTRRAGAFDVSVESLALDPSPWGLFDIWGCAGGANYARYCNRTADSVLVAAHWSRTEPAPLLRQYLALLAADDPAAFLYSRDFVLPLPRKYGSANLHPESPYRMVWTWGRRAGS
jgi:peptide/nickel transport system substrate-binding protein